MIAEDYVSFETAKLLKEKGFDVYVTSFYDVDGKFSIKESDWNWNIGFRYSAPTIHMAMKWLREVQGLNVYVRTVWEDDEVHDWKPVVVGYDWFVESSLDNAYLKMSKEPFLTYEEACEAAIKHCLENLI